MSTHELKFDDQIVDSILEQAMQEVALLFAAENTAAISDPVWDWPNAPSPRDVVDTGRLRASQRLDRIGKLTFRYAWNTEYAAAVHEGAVYKTGRTMTARPWTRLAVRRFDLPDTYAKIVRRYLGSS